MPPGQPLGARSGPPQSFGCGRGTGGMATPGYRTQGGARGRVALVPLESVESSQAALVATTAAATTATTTHVDE